MSYYLLYGHCVITKGALFTTLANLNSGEYKILPNVFGKIVAKSRTIAIEELELFYNSNGQIFNLLNQLQKENYGAFYKVPQKENKPARDKNIYDNILLSNIIIDFSNLISEKFVDAIENMGCEALLISIDDISDNFFNFLKKIENSNIANLQIVITEKWFSDEISAHLINLNKLSHIIITNASYNAVDDYSNSLCLMYTTDSWNNLKRRMEMDSSFFVVNKKVYFEAKTVSIYFHKKLYIDLYGNIFNAPSSDKLLGNLTDDIYKSLMNVLTDDTYLKFSLIDKEKCDVCKNCEYRFMCSDKRMPIVRKGTEVYFLEECNYNPYIAKWNNEVGYKTLAESGIISNAEGFKINRKRINAINKELWGDD